LKDFARDHVANHPGLFDAQEFPLDLLPKMEAAGLLRATGPVEVAQGAEILARETGSLGFSVFWAAQALAPLALVRYSSLPQEVATGAAVIAMAFSEPNVGTQPRRLTTTATRVAGGWRLDGEKSAFITNGPIASHVVVLAITGRAGSRNEFSIFLVPMGTQGLRLIRGPQLDYLRPAMHCGLRLEGCFVPEGALLGREGTAFEDFAKPYRNLEDAVFASGVLGALAYCVRTVARAFGEDITRETVLLLGELAGIETALEALNTRITRALASWDTQSDSMRALLVAFDDLGRRSINILRCIASISSVSVERGIRDTEKLFAVTGWYKEAAKMKLGRSYFAEEHKS